MENIRLGNDVEIKFRVDTGDGGKANIKQIMCYLVNTSLENVDIKNLQKFGPPPPPMHFPDSYCIDICGPACYHYQPWDTCHKRWHFFKYKGGRPVQLCEHKSEKHDLFIYETPARILSLKNAFSVIFPGLDQKYPGEYKLVVKAVVFKSGWGDDNIKTYMIDKGVLFNLVTDGGNSGDITINVDDISDDPTTIDPTQPIDLSSYVKKSELNKDIKDWHDNNINDYVSPIDIKDSGKTDASGVNPIDSLEEILV